ncbi:hypothetical protein [Paraburkholderia sp. CI3]|uniref:hypothetical protein n=1 Tax=Paraburkholderia sp. CI3 TaxID=2991060 RepID=UPI003D21AFA8
MNQSQCAQPGAAQFLLAAMTLCVCATAAACTEAGHLTLAPEAPVTLIRGTSMFVVDAPVVLLPGDLLATDAHPGAARLADDSGMLAALGPQTHIAITPRPRTANQPAHESLSLLSGWLKVAYKGADTAEALGIDTPALHTTIQRGSTVIHATSTETELFVETGNVVVSVPEAPAAPMALGGDLYLQRIVGQQPEQQARPASGFVDQLPTPFRDPLAPLPLRASALTPVQSQAQQVTYADLADWLTSSLPIRRTFVFRFRGLAQREPFHSSIGRNLLTLPEWWPVLYPPRKSMPRSTSRRTSWENS